MRTERTHSNLLDLLAKGESADWVVAEDKVQKITHFQVVNFTGTQMIEAVFDRKGFSQNCELQDHHPVVLNQPNRD